MEHEQLPAVEGVGPRVVWDRELEQLPPAAEEVVALEQLAAAEGAGPGVVRELQQLPVG